MPDADGWKAVSDWTSGNHLEFIDTSINQIANKICEIQGENHSCDLCCLNALHQVQRKLYEWRYGGTFFCPVTNFLESL